MVGRCRDEKTGAWRPLTQTPFSKDLCNATELFEDSVILYLYTCHVYHYTKVMTSLNVENMRHRVY